MKLIEILQKDTITTFENIGDVEDLIEPIFLNSSLYSEKYPNKILSYKRMNRGKSEIMTNHLEQLIINFRKRLDKVYCTKCKTDRVFAPDTIIENKTVANVDYPDLFQFRNNIFYKTFRCSSDPLHILVFGFLREGGNIIKIAEYPSKFDLSKNKLNKYDKVLSNTPMKDLKQALQLQSYGYAIASFVHYRRIFEFIIGDTYRKNETDEHKLEEFKTKRMNEKVELVKDNIASYLYQSANNLYGILSKGIHQLEEKECNEYLSVIGDFVIYSLDEMLEQKQKEDRKRKIENNLKNIASKISKE